MTHQIPVVVVRDLHQIFVERAPRLPRRQAKADRCHWGLPGAAAVNAGRHHGGCGPSPLTMDSHRESSLDP